MSRGPVRAAPKVMPANEEAEQALLGAILANNAALDGVAGFLLPEHFYIPVNGRIYERCLMLHNEGRMADPITLRRRFEQDGDLDDVGGVDYLIQLASGIVSTLAAVDYGKEIADLAARRMLIATAQELMDAAYLSDANEVDTRSLLIEAQDRVAAIQVPGMNGHKVRSMLELSHDVQRYWDRMTSGELKPVSTGLADLDRMIGGILPGDVIYIGGRPGMGKSTLLRTIGTNRARRGDPFLFFSSEVSGEQVAMGLVQQTTAIRLSDMKAATMDRPDFTRAITALQENAKLPIWVDDSRGLTVARVVREARDLMRRLGRPLAAIGIDYLQLMRGHGRLSNRNEEVSQISRDIKAAAGDLGLPILAAVQLKRPDNERENKRPTLSDMRESGQLEADADAVVLIHREEYYHLKTMPTESTIGAEEKLRIWGERLREIRGLADLICAKVRAGPEGVVQAAFDAKRSLFADHAPSRPEDEGRPRSLLDLDDDA